jgi:ParB-like chromosome segregation protein Spo0J|tara:strand:+ start:3071 stop:3646 length:576 start_codon:yes stop_codon:yes gene_type:complete
VKKLNINNKEKHPINNLKWIPINQISANDYNPNIVAGPEMKLLYNSIKNDGFTQPIVTVYDSKQKKYIIVDGFHRYFTAKENQDILESTDGCVPIVVLDKDMNERMASTVRHNRARGKHTVKGMSNMVFEMLQNGWSDKDICNQIGMEPEELLRLKHITGFSKLFENVEYSKSWESRNQLLIKKRMQNETG